MRGFTREAEPAELAAASVALTAVWQSRVDAATPGHPAAWTWGPEKSGKTVRDHILPVLKKQTGSHCSYCDLYFVAAGSVESVDHFRPKAKGRWPALAYTWSNLFYACGACQSEKQERFDERVIKPDEPGYDWMAHFRFNTITGFLVPRGGTTQERLRARVTIKLFGLNQRDRPKARLRAYKDWIELGRPSVRGRSYRFCLVPPDRSK